MARESPLMCSNVCSSMIGKSRGRINAVALHYYVDFYNFVGLRLDYAFRSVAFQVCGLY